MIMVNYDVSDAKHWDLPTKTSAIYRAINKGDPSGGGITPSMSETTFIQSWLFTQNIYQLSKGHLELAFNLRLTAMTLFECIILCLTPTDDTLNAMIST